MKGIEKSSIIKSIKKELMRNGIRRASLFGSLHSGNFTEKSDIDIMIEPTNDMSLLDLAKLKRELEEIVGFRVDIITYNSLDIRYKERFISNSEELI